MSHKYLALLLFPASILASNLPKASNVPGGIVIQRLTESSIKAPLVFYQHQRVLVIKQNEQWNALIGIPLDAEQGAHSITVIANNQAVLEHFDIVGKDYPAQYITIKNKRMVNPNPDDLERIQKERIIIDDALSTWTETDSIDIDFIPPVDGKLSSQFGLKRFFNNQPKNPHSGLDIAAPAGTPIVAPADAKVVNTGNYYFNGNSVILDHGQGLISGYFHMQAIAVKKGQTLQQGQIIGTVGETGRVTGPHLHWNVYLNSYKIDPALFINDFLPQLTEKK